MLLTEGSLRQRCVDLSKCTNKGHAHTAKTLKIKREQRKRTMQTEL